MEGASFCFLVDKDLLVLEGSFFQISSFEISNPLSGVTVPLLVLDSCKFSGTLFGKLPASRDKVWLL